MRSAELYQHAVSLLSRKDYSNNGMRRALHHLSDDGMTVEDVIVRLGDNNYLNDQRMAENMVSRLLRKQYGPLRIRLELRQKGIEQDVADKAISDSGAVLTGSRWPLTAGEKNSVMSGPQTLTRKYDRCGIFRVAGLRWI